MIRRCYKIRGSVRGFQMRTERFASGGGCYSKLEQGEYRLSNGFDTGYRYSDWRLSKRDETGLAIV